jgi:N-acetylglucosamine-6-sulfatase
LTTLLAAGCSGTTPVQEEPGAPTRPNIIFLLMDDLNFATVQQMPELRSSVIEEGASFQNNFISYPLCCPSRATILTGLYAHNHDVRGNAPPDGGFQKFRSDGYEESTIAVRLQQSGYETGLFGEYLNYYLDEDPTHVPPGWDEWHARGDIAYYDYELNENGEIVSYGNETEDYFTDVLSRKATEFVRRATSDSQPFFLYLAPAAPHEPAIPAERHQGVFAHEEAPRPPSFDEEDVSDKPSWIREIDGLSDEQISEIDDRYRNWLASMLAVDEMVASLVQELEIVGELDNTFIFFTSDNGYHQGEHLIDYGKNTPYEESARVPLFVRGPGVAAGSKVERLALNTDFAPTFADLAGIESSADGRSLAPLLRGEDPVWRSAVLLEGFSGGNPPSYEAVRTETHKYVEYDNGETELYDLEADPYELENLPKIADPFLVADLNTKLNALRSCAGDECQKAEDDP